MPVSLGMGGLNCYHTGRRDSEPFLTNRTENDIASFISVQKTEIRMDRNEAYFFGGR